MYENFPYSNFHDLNTDWLIDRVKNVETSEANAKASEENAKASELNASLSDASAQTWALQANNSAKRSSEQARAAAQSAIEANNYVTSTRDQVNLLQSRVDNIIPSGTQTEGNTELLDIRVAEDGQIYDSAGNAVRGQVRSLKNALNVIEVGYKQYLTSDIIQGSYNADGTVAPNPNRIRISGFVELNEGDTLSFKPGTNVADMLYGTYDESKDFQGDSQWYASEHTITTDKHIYVICVFKNSTGTSISPSDFDATVVKTLSATNAINNFSEMLNVSISPTTGQIIENRYITTDGELSGKTEDANATDYVNISDIVSDSLTIRCTVYGYAGFAIYDANKTVILSVTGDNSADYGITPGRSIQTFRIQRPDDAYYIRLSAWKSAYTQPSDLKTTGGGYGDLNSRLSLVEREIDSINTGTLSDKKVLVIGDSISTDAYGHYKKWVTDLINADFFDGEKVTNSSQHATGFVARYDNQPNDFITRLKAVENPSQYDLVVVFGGINDYIQNIPMGSESGTDYTVSFKPAVNEFFNYLIENFTQARLCVLLPLRTYATWTNSVDEYQQAYGDYIKTVAKSYCLPVLNLTENSGFFPWKTKFRNMWTLIPQGYENGDGVHPNEAYQSKYLAPMIKGFLKGLL